MRYRCADIVPPIMCDMRLLTAAINTAVAEILAAYGAIGGLIGNYVQYGIIVYVSVKSCYFAIIRAI